MATRIVRTPDEMAAYLDAWPAGDYGYEGCANKGCVIIREYLRAHPEVETTAGWEVWDIVGPALPELGGLGLTGTQKMWAIETALYCLGREVRWP